MNDRRMDPALRIVTRIPLTELWDEAGPVAGRRGAQLATDDLRRRLREGPVRFVVADVGGPLRWLSEGDCYAFWKTELKDRIVDGETFFLEDYPDEYCYAAQEWHLELGGVVVLLEMHH